MEEFDRRFRAVATAGDGVIDSGEDIQAFMGKVRAAQRAVAYRDFCPWVSANRSKLDPKMTQAPQFSIMMKEICPQMG